MRLHAGRHCNSRVPKGIRKSAARRHHAQASRIEDFALNPSIHPGKARTVAAEPMRRLFLVGCPRSGTTLLQAAIGRLPGVFTLPETAWFTQLLGALGEWTDGRDEYVRTRWRRRLALASPRTHGRMRAAAAVLDGAVEGLPRLPLRLRGSSYIGDFVRLMDRAATLQGCGCWLEKTPDHFAYIGIIARYIPDARFLHLIRNCEDVVASAIDGQIRYADRNAFSGGITHWVRHWNRAAETHLRYAGAPRHLVLRYEDFIAAPQATLQLVRGFAGLGAGAPGTAPAIADLSLEPWKAASLNHPPRRPQRKFEQLFGPQLRAWLRQQLGDYEAISAELQRRQAHLLPPPAAPLHAAWISDGAA